MLLAVPTICLGAIVAGGTITPTYLSVRVAIVGIVAYAAYLWGAGKKAAGQPLKPEIEVSVGN